MIDDPKVKKVSGGRLAAPLFAKIMSNALRVLDIAPDNLAASNHALGSTVIAYKRGAE